VDIELEEGEEEVNKLLMYGIQWRKYNVIRFGVVLHVCPKA